MLYSRSEHTRHLVTAGNLGFVANGTDLYRLVKKGDKFKKYYNVAPGQMVMWSADPSCTTIPKTIDPANLDALELATLRFGVGRDADGDGLTEAIRLISPDKMQGCSIDKLDAVAPQCATPYIKALYPECVSCDTTTIRARVYDSDSIAFSEHALKAYHEFVGSFTPDCGSCDDCEKTTTCDEVICGLVDAMNNDTNFTINGDPYPHYYNTGVERPFKAFKIHNTWLSYCISPNPGTDCVECNNITALTTFTVQGVNYNFDLVDPKDNTKTLVAQLELAVDMINQRFEDSGLKHGGFAFLSRGQGACCPMQIFVTTCDATFAIAGLTPCANVIDQWPDFIKSGTCKQCGVTPTTTTPSCGIGFFVRPDFHDCNCWELNQPKQFMDRWIDVDFVSGSGNDNVPKHSNKATLLTGQTASGFGASIQYLEYANNIDAIGFEGFQYDLGNTEEGWQGLPRASSRVRQAITADCDKSYCSYYLRWRGQHEFGAFNEFVNVLTDGNVHVPQTDTVTKTAIEALFTRLTTIIPQTCKVLTSAVC